MVLSIDILSMKYFVKRMKLFGVKYYIIFLYFKLRCLIFIEECKTISLHYDLVKVILYCKFNIFKAH